MNPGGKQSALDLTPSSRWKFVMYHVLRQSDGGVKVVLKGPRLERVMVSVNVAEEDVSQVVFLVVVMTVLDIASAS